MNEEDKNEGQGITGEEEIWIPPNLPVLDSPIKSVGNISDTSSVYEMGAPIKLSKFETLIAGGTLCLSEPVSEASDDDGNDSVLLLKNIKNHPDNQAFILKPAEETAMSLITDDQDLDEAKTSLVKINTARSDVTEDLLPKVSSNDNEKIRQKNVKRCGDKALRKLSVISYNEQSEQDDGDFSPTDGSDYISDSDDKSQYARKTKRCFSKHKNKQNPNNITVQALIHADTNSTPRAHIIVPETPDSSFEKDNTSNSKRPIRICDESSEKDSSISLSHLEDKTYRSSDEKLNYDAIEILYDDSNNDIDLGDVEHVLEDITPSKPASQRSWDRRNCCLYCENLVTNFTRHLIRNHCDEIEVLKLMAINDPDPKIQKKQRQVITDDLRNRGNYIHNSNVVSNKEGYLIPTRRKTNEELSESPSRFVICKKCLGTYRRSTFYSHSKKCIGNEDGMTKHALAKHALSIIPNFVHTSKEFKQNILPRLRNDEIALIVKQDPLIIAYGCRLLKKKKEKRSVKLICSKMRDLGNLLKIVREKNSDIVQLQNLIDPKYYECFIEAVKVMSGFNEETGHVKVISIPARIRPEILGCIDILFTNTIMDKDKSTALKEHIKNKLSEFKLLLEANWQWEISSNAEKTRKRNLMTKAQVMPLEKDIEKVMIKIHELEEIYYDNLKKDTTIVNYENLCEVTIAHIILLDRKRSGDVAEAELQYYLNRKTDEIPPQVLEMLNKNQKQAISDLDIFQIPGKRGRSVPVLLTKVMKRNLDVLITCRSTLNISSDYLFARPLTDKPFDGGRCLNKIKNMCNLKKPEMLTSTGLRHHIATISQVHSKTDDKYTQHLAAFLGHDMQVHASNYRLPIQAIQKGLVGSRLLEIEKHSKTKKDLLIEKEYESVMTDSHVNEIEEGYKETDSDTHSEENETSTCDYNKGKIIETNKNKEKKTVEEINDDKIEYNESGISIINEENKKENYQQNKSVRYKERSGKTSNQVQSSDTESSTDIPLKRTKYSKKKKYILSDDGSDEERTKPKAKIQKKTRNKWSSDEVEAVMRHLKPFIKKKKNPGKALCEEVLRKEPVLHKRTWVQINSYINNIYKKNL